MVVVDYGELQHNRHLSVETNPSSVTIGVFDGIHKGHVKLLHTAFADDKHQKVVVTFRDNPKAILYPDSFGGCILTLNQKLEHLKSYGVDVVVLIDFSTDFSTLQGTEFMTYLAGNLTIARLVVGSNFRCGAGASFTADKIREFFTGTQMEILIVDQLKQENGLRVSSSYIRECIRAGDMETAAHLLDREHAIDLSDIDCKNDIGQFTIDATEIGQLLPPPGVYLVSVQDDREVISGSMEHDGKKLSVKLEHAINTCCSLFSELRIQTCVNLR